MVGERFLVGVILGVAAWVRLSGLDLGWFLQDQVRDGMIALGIVRGQEFPLVGPLAATGKLYLAGPLYYYLLAIPYGVSANPTVGVAFLNLLNLVSVYLAYRLGKEMFGSQVGLTGATLYAVFPMAVLSSKALWNPAFIPVLTTLFFLTLWRFLVRRQPWTFGLVLLLLGVLLQIHASGAVFVVLLPVSLILYRSALPRWPLVLGLLCVVLLFAPYVFFEVQHGLPDMQKLLALVEENDRHAERSPVLLMVGRALWVPFVLPERMAAALLGGAPPRVFSAAQRVEFVLFGLGLLALGGLLAKAENRRPYLLLALWLVLPFALVFLLNTSVMWYYFDILYPAQFLAIGLLTRVYPDLWPKARAGRLVRNALPAAMAVVAGGLFVVQAVFMMTFERAVDRSGIVAFTTDINLGFPDPAWHVKTETILETMPLRFKRALADRFLREFGVNHAALERTAHGAVYQQFREDKGFSFLTVRAVESRGLNDPSFHYVLLRDGTPVVLDQGREVGVGPYRIVGYRPTIQYDSWRWSTDSGSGWWSQTFADSTWQPLTLPARRIPDPSTYEPVPYARWPGKTVTFRGWIEVSSAGRPLWLVLNIRDDHLLSHQLESLYLNGQAIGPIRTVSYNTVDSRNLEIIADVTSALGAGPNLVAFQVAGMNGEFDLDVYELRPAAGITGR